MEDAGLSCHSADGCATLDAAEAEAALVVALEAFVSTDSHGHVIAWNQSAERTFGYTAEQACGMPLEELIIAQWCRAAYRKGLAPLITRGTKRIRGQRLQLTGSHSDGRQFPMELTLTVTRGSHGHCLHIFARDITARMRAERFVKTQAAVSHALAEAASAEDAGAAVVEAVGDTLRWPIVELWMIDHARSALRCVARHVTGSYDGAAFELDELDCGVGAPGAAWATNVPVWVSDPGEHSQVHPGISNEAGLHVAVAVPIGRGATVTGVLACYGECPEDPEDTLLALLGGIAAHLSQYLERRRAEELAIELARAKDDILALVTHELRNPLAVVVACTNLLEAELDDLSPELLPHLRSIGRATGRLTALINDLLDLTLLESGQLVMNLQTVELCQIIDDAVADIQAQAKAKHLTITVEHPERLSLRGDGPRLRQVADNLLSNAVKYTPDGGAITVTATSHAHHIDWTVTDTGIGIPPSEKSKVFHRFYRTSNALENAIPGTGLGLAITRTIIERHDGTIGLDERPGPGTTFRVGLPDDHLEDCQPATVTASDHASELASASL